mmetsp:Transcript_62574/g.149193  ORF Transcript_62574/g.149193 Transcript_62574/m.149193 type:complete len:247 (-) Transcript_62574:2-742(-)
MTERALGGGGLFHSSSNCALASQSFSTKSSSPWTPFSSCALLAFTTWGVARRKALLEDSEKTCRHSWNGAWILTASGARTPARPLKKASRPSSLTVARRSTRWPHATKIPDSSTSCLRRLWRRSSTQTPSTTATAMAAASSVTRWSRIRTTAQPLAILRTRATGGSRTRRGLGTWNSAASSGLTVSFLGSGVAGGVVRARAGEGTQSRGEHGASFSVGFRGVVGALCSMSAMAATLNLQNESANKN